MTTAMKITMKIEIALLVLLLMMTKPKIMITEPKIRITKPKIIITKTKINFALHSSRKQKPIVLQYTKKHFRYSKFPFFL